MNLFSKIKFFLIKPKVIIITGNGRACAKEAIFQVLNKYFKIGKEILILETDLKKEKKFEFLIKHSSLPILVVAHIGDISKDYNLPSPPTTFRGDELRQTNLTKSGGGQATSSRSPSGERAPETIEIRKLAKLLLPFGYLILNFDNETVREIKDYNLSTTPSHIFTFGFQEGADFQATDIKLNSGTNFKVNYKGNIVPVWLEGLFGKEQIYSVLAAAAVGTIFGLNLVEISQTLKNIKVFKKLEQNSL